MENFIRLVNIDCSSQYFRINFAYCLIITIINVVGGVRVMETSADLALLLAVVSSFRDRPLGHDLMVFGEVGLSGEIRPVPSGQERLREAAKHGFKKAIVPVANAPKEGVEGMTVIAVKSLQEALDAID